MHSRAEFLKRLRQDPQYRRALEMAKDEAERRRIISITEEFVGGFADVLSPLIEKAKQDPTFAERLGQSLAEGRDLISESEPAPSGSQG